MNLFPQLTFTIPIEQLMTELDLHFGDVTMLLPTAFWATVPYSGIDNTETYRRPAIVFPQLEAKP